MLWSTAAFSLAHPKASLKDSNKQPEIFSPTHYKEGEKWKDAAVGPNSDLNPSSVPSLGTPGSVLSIINRRFLTGWSANNKHKAVPADANEPFSRSESWIIRAQ